MDEKRPSRRKDKDNPYTMIVKDGMDQYYDVFISYRCSDGTALARAVRDYLTKRDLRVVFK